MHSARNPHKISTVVAQNTMSTALRSIGLEKKPRISRFVRTSIKDVLCFVKFVADILDEYLD